MFELYYALYKVKPIDSCILTLLSATVTHGFGGFNKNKFWIDKQLFPDEVGDVLKTVRSDKINSFSWEEIAKFQKFFLDELKRNRFMIKIPLIGIVPTRRLKKYIKRNLADYRSSILDYIDSGSQEFLAQIDPRLGTLEMHFPDYEVFGSFFGDVTGRSRPSRYSIPDRPYDEYATISGKKRKIGQNFGD